MNSLVSPYRQVEILHLIRIFLDSDKLHDIRMVHPQHPHVGPSSRPSLLDDLCRHIKDSHK